MRTLKHLSGTYMRFLRLEVGVGAVIGWLKGHLEPASPESAVVAANVLSGGWAWGK
jgi:hypothetical protein